MPTIDYKKLKPTDEVQFDGPDAFKSMTDAQQRIIDYMASLTPEERAKEAVDAQKRIDARKAAGTDFDYGPYDNPGKT